MRSKSETMKLDKPEKTEKERPVPEKSGAIMTLLSYCSDMSNYKLDKDRDTCIKQLMMVETKGARKNKCSAAPSPDLWRPKKGAEPRQKAPNPKYMCNNAA